MFDPTGNTTLLSLFTIEMTNHFLPKIRILIFDNIGGVTMLRTIGDRNRSVCTWNIEVTTIHGISALNVNV
jgi:hypothetical protein